MILRTWHGRTRLEDAEKYEVFMRERAAPDYQSISGLMRAIFTRRDDADAAHFLLVTVWQDIDSVRQFAGADPSKAKYYPEDDAFLLEKENSSLNHDIFYDSQVSS
jgi:heme-degrading monooxygenase HmoA